MVMDVMAPMEHPIAIGTNGDHHWIQWRSPLVIDGAIKMAPLAMCDGDVQVEVSNERGGQQWRQWHHWCQWSQWRSI
jgi:hypothetical protein